MCLFQPVRWVVLYLFIYFISWAAFSNQWITTGGLLLLNGYSTGKTDLLRSGSIFSLLKWLLLVEFEVRTVKYQPSLPSFFYANLRPTSAKRAGHESREKARFEFYSKDWKNEVNKILIISLKEADTQLRRPYRKMRPGKLTNHNARF